jgi:hypothetical protein
MTLLIPGVEIWILSRTYDQSRSEVDFLLGFLHTAFRPYGKHMFREVHDTKTGELIIETKWGSELRVASAKAKGTITGRELELALVAEPGWVPEDILNHLRARMSSRLGRIILLGTPQGYGGLLGRMINLVGRDPKTDKVIRITPEKRTLASGCPWNISMLVYNLDPTHNPEYVKSELKAARMELLDSEYASEFEGLMSSSEGSKFPHIKPQHCKPIERMDYQDMAFVVGIDQGPRNFAWVLIATDGSKHIVADEKFDNDDRTMKVKLADARLEIRESIRRIGGNPDEWKLTIMDTDPPLLNELNEFEKEGRPWPTEVTWKHRNARFAGEVSENWRKEVYEYINDCSYRGTLLFDSERCYLLHDQLMRAQSKPMASDIDSSGESARSKGWIISDPLRKDHPADAFVFAVWTLFNNLVKPSDSPGKIGNCWEEAQAGFRYDFAVRERRELTGYGGSRREYREEDRKIFEEFFGRKKRESDYLIPSGYSPYKDY